MYHYHGRNKMITYLCCRNDTKDYYIQLGFKVIPSDILLQNENLTSFGNRFKMKENLELDEKYRLKLMSIDSLCPRVFNSLKVDENLDLEQSIYDKNVSSRFRKMKISKNMKIIFRSTMDNISNNILQNRDHDEDTILFCSCDSLTEYITQIYTETMFLNIGKWFKQCFVEMIPKFDNKYYYQSQTTLIAIEHLQIQFYPVCYPELEFDKSSQWICVKCSLCDKKVFLKKQENESFNLFMMKVVYTVWFCHVYSYAIDEDDEFYKFNPDWNLIIINQLFFRICDRQQTR